MAQASDNAGWLLRCRGCGSPSSQTDIAKFCESCNAASLAPWDAASGQWVEPDLSPLAPSGATWIKADFDGQMEGRLRRGSGTGNATRSIYGFDFFRASLTNPQRVEAPPLKLEQGEPMPLAQGELSHAFVHFGADGQRIVELTLHDLRVHHWQQIGLAPISSSGGEVVVGRYRGIAYAAILDANPATRDDASQKVATHLVGPEGPDSVTGSTAADASVRPVQPSGGVQPDDAAPEELEARCFYCNLWVLLLLTLLAWYFCTWREAVIGVLGVGVLSCWQRRRTVPQGGSPTRRVAAFIPFTISLVGLWIFLGAWDYSPCNSPYQWAALLPLIGLVLSGFLNRCLVRALLFAMWLSIVYVHCIRENHGCAWPGPGSGQGDPAAQTGTAPGSGLPMPTLPPMPHLGQLPGKISEWLEGSATKPDVDDPNGVSLEDAIAHPELLDDCHKKVRFPNGLLFERDKADIRPELTAQLAQLSELRRHYPDRYLVVTGHSDATGEMAPDGKPSEAGHRYNLELSRQRAEAISQWLASNQVWPADAMRSEGYGSAQPLEYKDLPINLLSQVGIDKNRRVEIGFDCRKN